jgi:hypothetical protein
MSSYAPACGGSRGFCPQQMTVPVVPVGGEQQVGRGGGASEEEESVVLLPMSAVAGTAGRDQKRAGAD